MRALILTDIQNDFLPGGALAVPQGDEVIPIANRLQKNFALVIATQDWHPANHGSFAANHPGKALYDQIDLNGLPQTLWPVHCVQGTPGAELAPELERGRIARIFQKGTDPNIDSYSGFFDNGHLKATGLGEFLKLRQVTDVFVAGLATDYCVKFTALDALALGFKTHLIADACRGVNLEPEDATKAIEEMKKFRLGPLFTPPSLRGTIQRPAVGGGANWAGGGFDPETGMLYVRTTESYTVNQVCKNDGTDADVDVDYSNNCEFGAANGIFSRPDGRPRWASDEPRSTLGPIPLIKPPYAYLVAINLNQGEIAWRVPFGEGSPAIRRHPLLKGVKLPDRLGTGGSAGVLVTKTGLVFIGGGDPYLYAFDKVTGKELWRVATPWRTAANPMTYRSRSGRQFVLIASGAGPDATLTAFALSTGAPTTTTSAAPAPVATTSQSGADAFQRVCQPCHGPDGKGAVAPALVPMTKGQAEVLGIVREGTGQMPPISTRELTDEEVTRIVEHLRSLRN